MVFPKYSERYMNIYFDKSIAIVTKLYNRNLSISNFQGNLTLKSFIIKENDIYSMIILWLNLFVYNLKLDINFFQPFHVIFMIFLWNKDFFQW